MERPPGEASAARQAHDDRPRESQAPMQLAGDVDQLIESAGDEVGELHLADRTHADDRRADGAADDRLLGDRGVEHAVDAELLLQARRDLERPAECADVLAEQQNAVVFAQRDAQGVRDRIEVAQLHQAPAKPLQGAAPSPSGWASPSQKTPSSALAGSGAAIASASCVASSISSRTDSSIASTSTPSDRRRSR